jgi:uncharacterized RDD family membrane protein YckC
VNPLAGDPTDTVPVIGEAVALDLRVAQLPSRTLALAIDLLVQVPLLIVVLVLTAWASTGLDPALTAALALVGTVAVLVGYPTTVETLSHGRSLGKLAMGLRVVRDDGGPTRFRHALGRALFMIIEFWLTSGALGLIASLVSVQGQRLGDHFEGTLVVNERVTRAAIVAQVSTIPPGLEGWAATLDLSRLPEPAAAQARQLLARWSSLAPDVRERLATTLAGEIAARVTPPPLPGCPPAAYLAAVLGERGRRAYLAGPARAPSSPDARPRPAAPPPQSLVNEPRDPAPPSVPPPGGGFVMPS